MPNSASHAVYAMGVHYGSFNQESDAHEWAHAKSIKFKNHWWEVRHGSELVVAFENGRAVYRPDNSLVEIRPIDYIIV